MKEMPKEIWLHNVTNPSIVGATWLGRKVWDNDIEYVHKDAFIEKACDMYCKVCGHYAHKTPTYICRQTCDYYKDFRKHIEEE